MKKVLALGAGLVARPLVRYLLDQPDFSVTVATRTISKAAALVDGHERGTAVRLVADDRRGLEELVRGHDLAVSLLPAPLHPIVAEMCIRHRKHMVTTSYVSPAMKTLDRPARDAGVMIFNELGVDPGIDHMSAMRIIHQVKARGGTVTSFKSYCGGLPAPEDNDNPFGYKFSWSPRAVCTAGKNAARYRRNGEQVEVPASELFLDRHILPVDGIGELEAYPNRDSLSYVELYGLEGIATMFRGTLRYPGWCETLKAIVDLGLLDESPVSLPASTTAAEFLARVTGIAQRGGLRKQVASRLGPAASSAVVDRLEWLGLFGDERLAGAGTETTALDVLASLMSKKMMYGPGERDMICLCHLFDASLPAGPDERITSTLIEFGEPRGDSAMARTVSLPAAVATRLILIGAVDCPGVHIPVNKDIYEPVLTELEQMGIRCEEKTVRRGE